MSGWTTDELARIDRVDELGIASRRPDGSLRRFITIWFVRLGNDLYVRSAHGYSNPWFQRALASGEGRIRAGSLERDVAFEVPPRTSPTASTPHTTRSTTATGRGWWERSCRRRPPGRRSGSSRPKGAQASGDHRSEATYRNRAGRP